MRFHGFPELILRHAEQRGSHTWTQATISAMSAIAGPAIGGLTSGLMTLLNQSAQARAEQIRHDLGRREDLVKDFIAAASTTYGEALVTSEPNELFFAGAGPDSPRIGRQTDAA